MGMLIFLLVIVGIIWWLKQQKGWSWGAIFGGVATIIAGLTALFVKSNRESNERDFKIKKQLSSLTDAELFQFTKDLNHPYHERYLAHQLLIDRGYR